MAENKTRKVLIGIGEITGYLNIREPMFKKFIGMGLPVIVLENRYYAHADNLDDFFRLLTRRGSGKIIEEEAEQEQEDMLGPSSSWPG